MKRKKPQPFMRIVLMGILFLVLLAGLRGLFARVRTVKREEQFTSQIMDHDLVIALFYTTELSQEKYPDVRSQRRKMRSEIKRLRRTFKIASDTDPYKYAGVRFITVDTSREKLSGIVGNYNIPKPTPNNPVFALFKGEELVSTKRGFLSVSDIKTFIDGAFSPEIKKMVKERDKELVRSTERAKRAAYRRSYRYYYGGPYYYGRPWYPGGYWGYGGPWGYRYGRPGIGIGFGVGGYYGGYGRGYYGGYGCRGCD